ncbi:hypothetical protein C8J57DRAFT_1634962 [Mycena rebaudengoi]|nr:hypothetical protein C8J57DRAFT_1634962 [Mycena rebaudengoi]
MANPPKSAPRKKKKPKPAKAVEPSDDSDSELEESTTGKKKARCTVNWVKNPQWTELLITYLCENPSFRIRLFSDSTAEAKKAGRQKLIGKDGKPQQYAVLAEYIFKDDEAEKARYANAKPKFAMSVDTRLRRLKKEYKEYCGRLGATGAGLDPEAVLEGSNIANLIDEIREEWPHWDDLHAFWRELPNYNPIGVQSSQPGTNHGAAASALFESQTGRTEDEADDGLSDASRTRRREEDTGGDENSVSSSPDNEDEDIQDMDVQDPKDRTYSPEITPPPPFRPAAPPVAPSHPPAAPKGGKAVSGRDLGLAKASSARSAGTAKKKHPTAVDRFNDLREVESERMDRKRQMVYDQDMAKTELKRMKLELKLINARNEAARLAQTVREPSYSPHRRRLLGLSSPASPRVAGPSRAAQVGRRQRDVLDQHPLPTLPLFPPTPSSDAASTFDNYDYTSLDWMSSEPVQWSSSASVKAWGGDVSGRSLENTPGHFQ